MKRYFFVLLLMVALIGAQAAPSYAQQDAGMAADLKQQMEDLQAQIDGLTRDAATGQNAAGTAIPSAQSQRQAQSSSPSPVGLQRSLYLIDKYLMDASDMRERLDGLCDQYINHCMFLSEFWRVRALKSCLEFNRYILEDMASMQEELTSEQRNFFGSSLEQCSLGYYVDHIAQMDKTINQAATQAKKQENKQ